MIQLIHGSCLDIMPMMAAKSVDLILTDLPYGSTQAHWDCDFDLAHWWECVEHVLANHGTVITTAMQPFTSNLIMSNPKWFRYSLVWKKSHPTGHLMANRRPLTSHEDIVVFSPAKPRYFPQGLIPIEARLVKRNNTGGLYGSGASKASEQKFTNYPRSVLEFGIERGLHGTQKPVPLLEYLINTYSLQGETVLDCCCGSGSTLVACDKTGRNGIGIELDPLLFTSAERRLA